MEDRNGPEEVIFTNARQITDPAERERYIQSACGSDAQLQNRIRLLLQVYVEDASFLESQVETTTSMDLVYGVTETVGSMIGPYELIEQIGAGGMGLVFLAQQNSPVRRQVALKVIRPGMDTREVVQRFKAERQTLAQLNHPGITRLLDAGTTTAGRPWFVMELARGPSITKFCRESALALAERLTLFAAVCDAVLHAHQNGVLHRDLKPSNVIVTTLDGRQTPRVIDFGVARVDPGVSSDDQAASPPFTLSGTRSPALIGTPAFMSPEQTLLPDEELDVRCDVYSLGLLLYELLTEIRPFNRTNWQAMSYEETLRTIRECVPPLPSVAVSPVLQSSMPPVDHSVKSHSRAAASRSSLLKGDLDQITGKAMHKDRNCRYQSVAALAEDVRRYLRHEPVEAGSPSIRYRVQKFVRRCKSRIAIATLALGVIALLLITLVTTWSLYNERKELSRQRQRSETQKQLEAKRASVQRRRDYADDIQSAYTSYFRGDVEQANQVLDKYGKDTADEVEEGFEWYLLKRFCHSQPQTLRGLDGKVFDVEFSPDSRLLASCTGDRGHGVNIWNGADGSLLASILDFDNDVNSLCFSADGTMLLTAEETGQVRVWNVTTWTEIADKRLVGFPWPVAKLHLAADNCGVIASQVNWGVHLSKTSMRSLGDSADQTTLEGARLLAIDEARGTAAFATDDSEISLCRLSDLSPLNVLPGSMPLSVCGSFSEDGQFFACGNLHGAAKVWGVQTGQSRTIPMHGPGANGLRDIAFSADSRHVITASYDGIVEVWDVASLSVAKLFHSEHGEAWSLSVSGDGLRFAVGYQSGHIQIHDWIDVLKPGRTIVRSESENLPVAASPDADRVAIIDPAGASVQIHSGRDGQHLQTIPSPEEERLIGLTFSAAGNGIWVCSETGILTEIELATGRVRRRIESYGERSGRPFMLCSGSFLARSSIYHPDIAPQVLDSTSHNEVFRMDLKQPRVWQCIWGFCDEHTILTSTELSLSRWNLRTGQEILPRYVAPNPIEFVGLTAHHKTALLGLSDGTMRVFDIDRQEEMAALKGHRGIPSAGCISPDGRTIATGSRSGDVRLWRLSTHQPLCELQGLTGQVIGLWFSADGKRLIAAAHTADGHGEVRVWDASGP